MLIIYFISKSHLQSNIFPLFHIDKHKKITQTSFMPAVIKRAGRRNVKKVQMKFNSRLKWCKFTGRKSFTLYSKPTNMHKLDVVVISTNLALEQISQFECLFIFFSIEWRILPWTVRQTKQQTWWTLKQQFNTLFK